MKSIAFLITAAWRQCVGVCRACRTRAQDRL